MIDIKVAELLELHEEYLLLHSHLIVEGKYKEAKEVEKEADKVWKEIAISLNL